MLRDALNQERASLRLSRPAARKEKKHLLRSLVY
jgi:hypothetical protein